MPIKDAQEPQLFPADSETAERHPQGRRLVAGHLHQTIAANNRVISVVGVQAAAGREAASFEP
jgi:hypothetical protein